MKIGKVEEKDGTVRNATGMKIGTVEKDGTVRNSTGMKIGKGSGGSLKAIQETAYSFLFQK